MAVRDYSGNAVFFKNSNRLSKISLEGNLKMISSQYRATKDKAWRMAVDMKLRISFKSTQYGLEIDFNGVCSIYVSLQKWLRSRSRNMVSQGRYTNMAAPK